MEKLWTRTSDMAAAPSVIGGCWFPLAVSIEVSRSGPGTQVAVSHRPSSGCVQGTRPADVSTENPGPGRVASSCRTQRSYPYARDPSRDGRGPAPPSVRGFGGRPSKRDILRFFLDERASSPTDTCVAHGREWTPQKGACEGSPFARSPGASPGSRARRRAAPWASGWCFSSGAALRRAHALASAPTGSRL